MSSPTFGMQFTRPADEAVPVIGADFSKVLVIETSEDASAAEYPLDTPVRISTSDTEAIAALGTGLLADEVRGINDQLDGLNYGADVTVVRVAEGVDTVTTAASIVAILDGISDIPSAVNATPRIIRAGRTAWRADLDTTNPVIAALPTACGKLLAIAPVDVDDTSAANAIDARETMNSERLLPVGVAVQVYEDAALVSRPAGSRVAGLFVRNDNAHEGKPFHPVANLPLYGLAALSRKVPFSLLDGSTEGQQMLEADVSIIAEGEIGVDGSIADGGFVFIGTDNTTTGDLWSQIHQVRGADYLTVKIMQITRQFLGRKMTASLVESWISSIAFMLRDHQADNDILGYSPRDAMFLADRNRTENIRLGHLTVNLGIEPAPSFKLANHEIRRYAPAVDGLVADIIARLSTAA